MDTFVSDGRPRTESFSGARSHVLEGTYGLCRRPDADLYRLPGPFW